jgi:cytochrome c biogenesis protein CcmG, thiol:disulfide interchange protein DsbE
LERDFGIVTDPFHGWLWGRAGHPDATTTDDRIVPARHAPGRAAAVLLALCLAAGLAGCSAKRPANGGGGGADAAALGTQPLVERTSEQFDADLGKLDGRVVVVNFWASWCVPCRTELPTFQRVSREFAGRPVTFVGVDASDQRGAAAAMLRRSGVTYPTVYDRKGIYGGIASHWSVTALPQTWFVARDGTRSLRVPRKMAAGELADAVKRLLGAA